MQPITHPNQFHDLFAAAHRRGLPGAESLLTVHPLDNRSLRRLTAGEVLATRVPRFIAPDGARSIANKLVHASTWNRYATQGAQGIEINGHALFECGGDRRCPEYFRQAVETRRAVRALLSPLLSPIDQMQAELDSAWHAGAQVLTLHGKKCHVGLQRCFRSGGEALHHTDRAHIDFADAKTSRMKFQLGLNCYLSVASGGELELWDLRPTDDLYDAARYESGTTYAIREEFLPAPDLVIRPEAGDFILFNAAKVHRVRPVTGDGARVTVSAFAAYFSDDEPLHIFS